MKKRILLITFLITLLDQIVKIIVDKKLILNKAIIIIKDFFNLTYVHNKGAAFSIMEGKLSILIIVSIFSILIIAKMIMDEKKFKKIKVIYYGFLLGGIFGNLIDRINYGYVIDFLDFKILNYNFPIFNISDMAIVIGAFLMIFDILRSEISGNKNK